jgi:hypothetical protein
MTAKLTVNETPTAQLLANAAAEFLVEDSKGRVFTLQRPGILAQFRIVEVMGASADIQTYRGMVTPLIYIAAIDGDPIAKPVNKLQLEALIQRVGDEGLDAVVKGIVKHFGDKEDDPEADKAAIKK